MAATLIITQPKKGLDELVARVRSTGASMALSVGVHKDETERENSEDPTNAQLAQWHEFGTRNTQGDVVVPKRPFLRPTMAENRDKYKMRLAKEYRLFLKGKQTPEMALTKLGTEIVADIQRRIIRRIDPTLQNATVRKKRKGGGGRPATPLYFSGQLFHSIIAKIVRGKK